MSMWHCTRYEVFVEIQQFRLKRYDTLHLSMVSSKKINSELHLRIV